MNAEIDGYDVASLLGSDLEELSTYFEQKYRLDVPALRESEIEIDQKESRQDVSGDRDRYISDRSQPFYVAATSVTYFVPFGGDPDLFKCRASTFTHNPPRGAIFGNELRLEYVRTDHNADAVKAEFERDLGEVKRHLGWIDRDCSQFNADLKAKARARIEARRARLQGSQTMAASLGFPIRRREGAPRTYSVPDVRRKVAAPPERKAKLLLPLSLHSTRTITNTSSLW